MVDRKDIRQQIITSADYYRPGQYAFGESAQRSGVTGPSTSGLLSFYRDLELSPDSLSDQYIPLSAVPQRGRNPKIFAVGILPPNQKVSGRLLDRSSSIRRRVSKSDLYAGSPTQEDLEQEDVLIEEDIRAEIGVPGEGSSPLMPERVQAINNDRISRLQAGFQPLVRKLIQMAQQEGIILVVSQGLRTTEEQNALYSKGRGTDEPKVTNAKGGNSWHNYGLAVDFAVYDASKQKIGIPPPPVRAIEEIWGRVGALGEGIGLNWGKRFNKDDLVHFDWHPGLDFPAQAAGVSFEATPATSPVQSDIFAGDPTYWQESGSKQASDSRRDQSERANTDIQKIRDSLMSKQEAQVRAIRQGLEAMAKAPPLRMLINPSKFSVKSSKIVQDGNWGRDGPIIEFWGDDQDKISGSGKVAGFYAVDKSNAGGPGLTRMARNFSQGYQNFQSLWMLYKNNGGMYLDTSMTQQNRDFMLSTVGSVYLYYDNILYFGSFDSFNVTETDDKPFTLEYSFEFTVRAAFLLDFPDELIGNRQQLRGSTLLQNGERGLPTSSDALSGRLGSNSSPVVQENGTENILSSDSRGNSLLGVVSGGRL